MDGTSFAHHKKAMTPEELKEKAKFRPAPGLTMDDYFRQDESIFQAYQRARKTKHKTGTQVPLSEKED